MKPHQDKQTIHFNSDCLNLVRGAIERDPVHATVYRLVLNVYWPIIDADIADCVKCCTICTKHKAAKTVQPMLPRDIPDRPW